MISGDTTYSENLIENSQGVDVLIHEVMAPALQVLLRNIYKDEATVNSIIATHTLPADAGKVFTQSKTRMGVYTHLINNPAQLPELIEETRKNMEWVIGSCRRSDGYRDWQRYKHSATLRYPFN